MARYRKLPVEADAWLFDGSRHCAETILNEAEAGPAVSIVLAAGLTFLAIETLEGTIMASPGDYVIRGVAGEFYPCKPDIFAQTYEPA